MKTKSLVRKRPSPVQRLSSSSSESDSDMLFEVHKRVRASTSSELGLQRRIRSLDAFLEEGERTFVMVHAADITSVEKPAEFTNAFEEGGKPVQVQVQFPSASQRER